MQKPNARAIWIAMLLLLPLAGCPKKQEAPPARPAEGPPPAAREPVGMVDPFPRLTGTTARALDRGYKALRTKQFDEAVAAFQEVVAAVPDHTATRFQLARALAQSGKLAEARQQLEQVLARDLVAYAGRAASGKEWKALRESPEWASYQAAEQRYRKAYAEGLDRGFVFVARHRPAQVPAGGTGEAKIDLNQEVYHFDPQTGRYRRLTSSGGQILAASRSPDGKTVAFLQVARLRRAPGGDRMVDPQAGFLELGTLTRVGPFRLEGSFHQVAIGFTGEGAPLWMAEAEPGAGTGTFIVDTARTGLARSDEAQAAGPCTFAQPDKVWHAAQTGAPSGVTMAPDGRSFFVEGAGKVTAARPLAPSSLRWSPGKKRLLYAGVLEACKVLAQGERGTQNEVYVYDVEKKMAQRIDSGVSNFGALWLDDHLLVYENGIGARGTLNLYDFAAHKKTQLAPRHGAGLYGEPSLRCDRTPAATEEQELSEGAEQ